MGSQKEEGEEEEHHQQEEVVGDFLPLHSLAVAMVPCQVLLPAHNLGRSLELHHSRNHRSHLRNQLGVLHDFAAMELRRRKNVHRRIPRSSTLR